MRKILLFLLLATLLSACDNDSDSNWNNRPGWEDNQNWEVYTITINAKDWQLVGDVNGDNSFYRCIVDDRYLDNSRRKAELPWNMLIPIGVCAAGVIGIGLFQSYILTGILKTTLLEVFLL